VAIVIQPYMQKIEQWLEDVALGHEPSDSVDEVDACDELTESFEEALGLSTAAVGR
jgi:hypothetical protein